MQQCFFTLAVVIMLRRGFLADEGQGGFRGWCCLAAGFFLGIVYFRQGEAHALPHDGGELAVVFQLAAELDGFVKFPAEPEVLYFEDAEQRAEFRVRGGEAAQALQGGVVLAFGLAEPVLSQCGGGQGCDFLIGAGRHGSGGYGEIHSVAFPCAV